MPRDAAALGSVLGFSGRRRRRDVLLVPGFERDHEPDDDEGRPEEEEDRLFYLTSQGPPHGAEVTRAVLGVVLPPLPVELPPVELPPVTVEVP